MVCHLCGTFRRDFKYDRQIWRDVIFAGFTQYRDDCDRTFPRAKIRQSRSCSCYRDLLRRFATIFIPDSFFEESRLARKTKMGMA